MYKKGDDNKLLQFLGFGLAAYGLWKTTDSLVNRLEHSERSGWDLPGALALIALGAAVVWRFDDAVDRGRRLLT